jgi:hypothetical protein
MRRPRALALCTLILLAQAGCVSWLVDPLGRRTAFDDSQREYTQLVRWGEIEKASRYVDPAQRTEFREQAAALDGIRITDFAITDVDYQDAAASVSVTYEGYSLDSLVERRIREQQDWYRVGSTNTWRVRSEVAAVTGAHGARR